jgi:hypothetical protein
MKSFFAGFVATLAAMTNGYAQEASAPESAPDSSFTIESIECRGNVITSCEFIRGKLRLATDTQVDDSEIQFAKLRLSALAHFRSVRISLQKGSARGKVTLIVEVAEADRIATEFAVGVEHGSTNYRDAPAGLDEPPDYWAETITGRISNQNLFGSDKSLEALASINHVAADEMRTLRYATGIAYIDPNLLGMEKWFMSATVTYLHLDSRNSVDTLGFDPNTGSIVSGLSRVDSDADGLTVQLNVGYRLWAYSYLLAGITHQRTEAEQRYTFSTPSLTSEGRETFSAHSTTASLSYGWDSEDDPYFPTRGSRLLLSLQYADLDTDVRCSNCKPINWSAAYKKTWAAGTRSAWSVQIGGYPAAAADRIRPIGDVNAGDIAVTYARSLFPSDAAEPGRRGRWYVQVGAGPFSVSRNEDIGGHPTDAHAIAGVRFESRVFGMVNLYVAVSEYWPRFRTTN